VVASPDVTSLPPPSFRSDPAQVRVPATSANLGPGFDALALALARYDDVVARISDAGLTIDVTGEGAADVPRDETHLVVRAMRAAFDRLGGQPPGIALTCTNRIPHGRGLGSSAAAICAGILLARALVVDGESTLDASGLLELATELEGHPDNVAACLMGGLTIAWMNDALELADPARRSVDAVAVMPVGTIAPVIFVPPTTASTAEVRRLLPASVPHKDASFNVGRAALLIAAMTARPEHLLDATGDRLHQPYRAQAMVGSAELVVSLRSQGIPAVISGAGPTVLALCRSAQEQRLALDCAPAGWESAAVGIDRQGALNAGVPGA
jgi:homoserine kinase